MVENCCSIAKEQPMTMFGELWGKIAAVSLWSLGRSPELGQFHLNWGPNLQPNRFLQNVHSGATNALSDYYKHDTPQLSSQICIVMVKDTHYHS